jgi:hypothetical protein
MFVRLKQLVCDGKSLQARFYRERGGRQQAGSLRAAVNLFVQLSVRLGEVVQTTQDVPELLTSTWRKVSGVGVVQRPLLLFPWPMHACRLRDVQPVLARPHQNALLQLALRRLRLSHVVSIWHFTTRQGLRRGSHSVKAASPSLPGVHRKSTSGRLPPLLTATPVPRLHLPGDQCAPQAGRGRPPPSPL